jgi:dual specificity phosphatase 12
MNSGKEIIKGLFIGSFVCAEDDDWLIENNIKGVLTVCEDKPVLLGIDMYLYLPTSDWGPMNFDYFEKCFDFIDNSIKVGNVMVHCFAGINRSASVIIAYIMYKSDCSYEEAYERVKTMSPLIDPTSSLISEIKSYFKYLNE